MTRHSGVIGLVCYKRLEPVPAKAGKVDPLVYPKCQGEMKIISSIENPSVILAITNFQSVINKY